MYGNVALPASGVLEKEQAPGLVAGWDECRRSMCFDFRVRVFVKIHDTKLSEILILKRIGDLDADANANADANASIIQIPNCTPE